MRILSAGTPRRSFDEVIEPFFGIGETDVKYRTSWIIKGIVRLTLMVVVCVVVAAIA